MKAKFLNFERDKDPKKSLKIGKYRFKKPGDSEIGNLFIRNHPEGNKIILINKNTGEEMEIGLYAAKGVIKALKFNLK
ncbi:MAG: hypothetical protein PHF86_01975 [Candidatus Nanoarchaeia archaeon]|nr:hypothetical protein [Candidatus Nanoarchaeia archaeon]